MLDLVSFFEMTKLIKSISCINGYLHDEYYYDDGFHSLLQNSTNGKQLPGYHWKPLSPKYKLWKKLKKLSPKKIILAVLLAIFLYLLGIESEIFTVVVIFATVVTLWPMLSLFTSKDEET